MNWAKRLWKRMTGSGLPMTRLLILNPASRGGRAVKAFNRMYPSLKEKYGQFELHLTSSPLDATERVRHALKHKECYQILVAGGDGTINEAVNGYFNERGKIIRKDVPLGVINLGTGGDFFKTLQAHNTSYEVAIQENCYRLVDCGCVTTGSESRKFLNIASAGMAGDVLKSLKSSSFQRGSAAFFFHALKTLIGYEAPPVRIRLKEPNGQWTALDDHLINFFVCNGRFNGGGMNWAPEGNLEDGIFDIVLISNVSKWKIAAQSGKVYAGKIAHMDGVREMLATEVILEHSGDLSLELDGEIIEKGSRSDGEIKFSLDPGIFPLIL